MKRALAVGRKIPAPVIPAPVEPEHDHHHRLTYAAAAMRVMRNMGWTYEELVTWVNSDDDDEMVGWVLGEGSLGDTTVLSDLSDYTVETENFEVNYTSDPIVVDTTGWDITVPEIKF